MIYFLYFLLAAGFCYIFSKFTYELRCRLMSWYNKKFDLFGDVLSASVPWYHCLPRAILFPWKTLRYAASYKSMSPFGWDVRMPDGTLMDTYGLQRFIDTSRSEGVYIRFLKSRPDTGVQAEFAWPIHTAIEKLAVLTGRTVSITVVGSVCRVRFSESSEGPMVSATDDSIEKAFKKAIGLLEESAFTRWLQAGFYR